MNVKTFKELVADWPETQPDGEPTRVHVFNIESGESAPVIDIGNMTGMGDMKGLDLCIAIGESK